jgi:hypothetical protein
MAFITQVEKKERAVQIKKVLNKYGYKGTVGVRHHSTLVVNLKSGPYDFTDQYNVNTYWIDKHYTGIVKNFLNDLVAAMKGANWYDNSDIMTDYFDVAYYCDINVGVSHKSPYVVTK